MRRDTIAAVLCAVLAVACTATPAATSPTPKVAEPPTIAPTATPSPSPTPLPHVFVIVMENRSLTTALRSEVINGLASNHALATNYRAVAYPSLPNYLALTSGSTHGVIDNGYYALPAGGIGAQLTQAAIPWRAYMEGLTDAGCMRSPYPYALKHNPFAYYGGACPPNVAPLEMLDADLARDTPNFAWITPGLCHDGHDCALTEAGAWVNDLVTRIVASGAFRQRGIIFIVWDEDDGASGNVVPLIVIADGGPVRQTATPYDHYSLLATIEDLFKLPRLGAAADASPIAELLPPARP